MKIIYDISPISFPLTGIGRFAFELGSTLKNDARLDDLVLFSRRSIVQTFPGPDLNRVTSNASPTVLQNLKQIVKKINALTRSYLLFNRYFGGFRLRNLHNHIFHGTNYYLPRFAGKKIATIYDLSTILHPNFHPADRVAIVNRHIMDACRYADRIITLSNYTRQEIVSTLSIPHEKVFVTTPGISSAFRPKPHKELYPLLSPMGICPGRYCLYVGTMDPRKNISLILDAYRGLPDHVRTSNPLVICGDKGWESQTFHTKLEEGIAHGWVRVMGYVPNEMLYTLLAGAALFVFPSYYEGFGFPPLEAMRCGIPVIVSNRTSLPEVVGDAALKIDPDDVDAWREAIRSFLDDGPYRDRVIHEGLRHANKFTWERCLEQTLAIYSTLK